LPNWWKYFVVFLASCVTEMKGNRKCLVQCLLFPLFLKTNGANSNKQFKGHHWNQFFMWFPPQKTKSHNVLHYGSWFF
jgi:hypothetical protein